MTNIIKITTDNDVHSHNEVLDFLKEHLRYGYVKEAKKRLQARKMEYSSGDIRNIKGGFVTDWKVLEILAEIALENKLAKQKVGQLIANQ